MYELQIVVFSLNDETCGVDTPQVLEIVKYQEIAKVPEMPEFIDGIINLRGKIVPIINLNKRFDLGATEITKKTKIIITKQKENYVGFVVNDVSEILRLTEEELEISPSIIAKAGNSYLKSIGKRDGKLISILDLNNILTSVEISKLESTEKA
jgi:purine-binding chemotaxis protein CheW